MNKVDHIPNISVRENTSKLIRVQVSGPRESETSYGVLVDLTFDEKGRCDSAMRLEWFTKSHCKLEKVEVPNYLDAYFLYAPEWLLAKNNVKYKL
ncbi:hypothetical protein [Flavobacterium psychrophilum]|uniref:Uncharacterized protein n=1 Tax=Flavobacterium psychrophilum TaxID=96345 RepID=A0A7U2NE50_FLAPS|nr:hypothetical protein [Flavobacterium psychrophilum]QRE03511.1 hypothetical protein H0H26_11565 [Flavobacterium psychrophilum]